MRTKIEWILEKLDESTFRAKVIGGWILLHGSHTIVTKRTLYNEPIVHPSESMCFIPDKDHEWVIKEKKSNE